MARFFVISTFDFSIRMGFSSSFVLIQKKKKQEEKIKAERLRGYSGKAVLALKNELASLHYAQTAFFSTARPFLRSRPYA